MILWEVEYRPAHKFQPPGSQTWAQAPDMSRVKVRCTESGKSYFVDMPTQQPEVWESRFSLFPSWAGLEPPRDQ